MGPSMVTLNRMLDVKPSGAESNEFLGCVFSQPKAIFSMLHVKFVPFLLLCLMEASSANVNRMLHVKHPGAA